jgi:hypothetical protein
MGLSDGKWMLRITVADYAWRNWWHGNVTEIQKEVVIDTKPPVIESLTQQTYVNQGGAGLAIYRLSEPCPTSGVRVGPVFFPGYSGYYADKSICIAFFALSYRQAAGTEIMLEATDPAGTAPAAVFPTFSGKNV